MAYAVSELLEGETLRAKLSGGALPARKAVEFAMQIVHGIAAAHQKGIVRRCLEKGPDERFHSAHDLGLALETLSGSGVSGQSAASMAVASLPTGLRSMTPWLLAAGVVVVAAAAFFAGHRAAGPAISEAPAYHRLTFRRGPIYSARYAGDGKTVVYSAVWEDQTRRLYSTREESPDSLALAFPNADIASIAASGELALVMNRRTLSGFASVGTLARASLSGGAARAVLEDGQDADWLPDGSGFAAARFVDGRYRLEFPVGKSVYESGGYISDVRVSPDGALVAFLDHPIFGDDRGSVAVIDRAGVKRTLAGEYSSEQGVAWAHGGGEIWFTGADTGGARALYAVTTAGVLRAVARVPGNLHLGDVGADGSVLLWQENSRHGLTGRAQGETQDRDLSWFDWSENPVLSADGRTLVLTEEGDGGGAEYSVYLRDMDGGPAVRLGSGAGQALSPDGKWVLTQRLNPPPTQLFLLPTGAGEAKQVTSDALSHDIAWFTSDGKHVVFSGFAPGHPPRLYLQPLSGGDPKPITPEGVTGLPSPDGALVAFDRRLYPVDGGAPRPIPGIEPDERVVGWASDPDSVLTLRKPMSGAGQVFRLDATGRRTPVRQIPPVPAASWGQTFAITPDGSAYVMTYTVAQADLFRVTGLK